MLEAAHIMRSAAYDITQAAKSLQGVSEDFLQRFASTTDRLSAAVRAYGRIEEMKVVNRICELRGDPPHYTDSAFAQETEHLA